MTKNQETCVYQLIDAGYTYYDDQHGDIILTRPSEYDGDEGAPLRVAIDNCGTITAYKGKNL